jgi:hypothetical protein
VLRELRQLRLLPLEGGGSTSLAAAPGPVYFLPGSSPEGEQGAGQGLEAALSKCGMGGPLPGLLFLSPSILRVSQSLSRAQLEHSSAALPRC